MHKSAQTECLNSCEEGYCYHFFHHKRLIGIAYLLLLAARLCRLRVDSVAGSALWWADTVLLLWLVVLLTLVTGRRWGRFGYAGAAVVSLTLFHVADLAVYMILAIGHGHISWQHTAVITVFTVFSAGPTIFLLRCDTRHYIPAARVIHAVTGVRIVILLVEAALYLSEVRHALPERNPFLYASILLTIAGHLLYEAALAHLAKQIHQAQEATPPKKERNYDSRN